MKQTTMIRSTLAGLALFAALPAFASTPQCQGIPAAQAQVAGATVLSPVAVEFVAANPQLGSQRGVLAPAFDDRQSLENVLLRIRAEGCRAAAMQAAPVVHAAAEGYVKKTEFDNTPYRFNMTQNGKRMTADDFDAWLQANGYSAGRRASAAEPAEAEVAAPQTEQ
ncbi:hypothetical protein [Luteimonas aestuarii]|nr:hypothetical protein [Luteimonas aestuarii]